MSNLTEVYDIQNTIISMQSKVIKELLLLLMQHEEVNKIDQLDCIKTINEIAKLKNEI